jgi:hypothetical protein
VAEQKLLSWFDATYLWNSNEFTWGDVAIWVGVTNAMVGTGIDIYTSPRIKKEVAKVATPKQIDVFVKIVCIINGKRITKVKKREPLTLKKVTVKEIHKAAHLLSVSVSSPLNFFGKKL